MNQSSVLCDSVVSLLNYKENLQYIQVTFHLLGNKYHCNLLIYLC